MSILTARGGGIVSRGVQRAWMYQVGQSCPPGAMFSPCLHPDSDSVSEAFSPVWQNNRVCLYASLFLYASITIMATVCRFFPSHLVGDFDQVGPTDGITSFLASVKANQSDPFCRFLVVFLHRTCSTPVFSSAKRLDAGHSTGRWLYTYKLANVALTC